MIRLLVRLYFALRRPAAPKYNFHCPVCFFYRVNTNDRKVLDAAIESHDATFHSGGN